MILLCLILSWWLIVCDFGLAIQLYSFHYPFINYSSHPYFYYFYCSCLTLTYPTWVSLFRSRSCLALSSLQTHSPCHSSPSHGSSLSTEPAETSQFSSSMRIFVWVMRWSWEWVWWGIGEWWRSWWWWMRLRSAFRCRGGCRCRRWLRVWVGMIASRWRWWVHPWNLSSCRNWFSWLVFIQPYWRRTSQWSWF